MIKKHGLKGDVKVHLASPLPENLESIFVELNNRLVPFFIEDISILQDLAIIKLDEVDGPEKADQLVRCRVFLPKTMMLESTSKSPDSSEMIGYSVFFKKKNLGIINGINEHALNPLLVVMGEQSEMLIPINDYFIKAVDKKAKKVTVELPDGFTEI